MVAEPVQRATRNDLTGALRLVVFCILMLGVLDLSAPARAESRLAEFLKKVSPSELFPGADEFSPVEGSPPAVTAHKSGHVAGYVFLNSDFADATGYSGKPIEILLGVDMNGVVTGARLVEHHEPIVLIGMPEKRVTDFIAGYVGTNLLQPGTTTVDQPSNVAVVSGATVTAMVISDSITRAVRAFAASRGIGGLGPGQATPAAAALATTVDMSRIQTEDWPALLDDGSVRRLHLSVSEVNDAFAHSGNQAAASRPEPGDPQADFIDLYIALVSVPSVGRSLLGPDFYERLVKSLHPGQQAVLIAGEGLYSFKGSGYVRGGIFDRIRVIQGEETIRFRDHDYSRLGDIAAADAPHFPEIGLFVAPDETPLDPVQPWRLQLLVQRQIGALDKAFLNFDLGYTLPAKYLEPLAPAVATTPASRAGAPAAEVPLWRKIWQQKAVDIGVIAAAIGLLTFIFFFQDMIVRRPRLTKGLRIGFLLFTVVFIGGYAHAQLSVVNVITFANILFSGFRWEVFLLAPVTFILWFSVAASLLFWGRGAFCGWLCPFGALQELLSEAAQFLRIPQIKVPWGLNQRLWPIKYIIFLVIFGTSLGNMDLAERLAEAEPFKTVIVLFFDREWPYVLYGGGLLVMSLFIERFFCRYLCPLGAALAIPGRLRMFDWLKRHKECGSPCQRCAHECIVQAIHPEGHINPHECHYCLYCQVLYYDDHKCPPMIQRRLKRERRLALSSKSMLPDGVAKATAPALGGTEV